MHSLEIVQWDSTRRDHPGNLGGVSGSGLVNTLCHCTNYYIGGHEPFIQCHFNLANHRKKHIGNGISCSRK